MGCSIVGFSWWRDGDDIIIFNHDRKVAHGLSDIHGIAYRIIYALATMENNN